MNSSKVNKVKRIFSVILAAAMALSLAACGSRPEPAQTEENKPDAVVEQAVARELPLFINTLQIPTSASRIGVVDNGLSNNAVEMHELNGDTIGWLHMENTTISEQVMWHPVPVTASTDEKFYYLRRDFNRVPNTGPLASQFGSYFADYRAEFEGGWQGMSRNTTIYGHSMDDDPNGKAFSQLKKYLDPDFARENPYLYFSVLDEDLAWEVFAVFYATVNLPYNVPVMDDATYTRMIDECLARSIYDYGIEIGLDDRIITLSTCTYIFTNTYPNNYRYVVMARLVEPGRYLPKEAQFTVMENPKAP